jgi:signal transduction histidine kinase
LAIKTELNNDKIKIIISDNGKGIEKEKLPYIFNKLYKCDNSRSNKGNGLGLAIVKELINKLNGSIEVVSKPDINTSFIIILPKA